MRINEDFIDDIEQDDVVTVDRTGSSTKSPDDYPHTLTIQTLKMDGFIRKVAEGLLPNRQKQLRRLKIFFDKNPMFSDYLLEIHSDKSHNFITISHDDDFLKIADFIEREEDGPMVVYIYADFRRVSLLSFIHSYVRLVRIIDSMFGKDDNYPVFSPRNCKYQGLRDLFYDNEIVYSETYNDAVFHLEDWINPINCLKQFAKIYKTLFDIDESVNVIRENDIDTLFKEWEIEFPEDVDIAKNMFLTKDTFTLPSGFRIYECTHGDLWTTGSTRLMIEGTPGNPMVRMSEVCKLLRNRADKQKKYMLEFMPELDGCIVYDELEEYSDYQIMPYVKWARTKNVTVVFDDISLEPRQIEGILDYGKKNASTKIIFSRFMGWMTKYVDIRVPGGFIVQPKRN